MDCPDSQLVHLADAENRISPEEYVAMHVGFRLAELHRSDTETQRVGRARSPLRAGLVGRTRFPRFESGFPPPYGRGYAHLQRCSGGL